MGAIAGIVAIAFATAVIAWCAYMTRGQQTNSKDLAMLRVSVTNQEKNLGQLRISYQRLVEQLLKERPREL